MKQIYNLRRIALLMAVFLTGVLVGGGFPSWIKIVFPAVCVLWIAVYDDARMKMERG